MTTVLVSSLSLTLHFTQFPKYVKIGGNFTGKPFTGAKVYSYNIYSKLQEKGSVARAHTETLLYLAVTVSKQ